MDYLLVGTATLVVFVISLIVSKKGKALSDYLLAFWLLIFLLNLATLFILNKQGGYPANLSFKILVEISEALIFMHGPVLLFYTLSLTKMGFELETKHSWHLGPFLFFLLIFLPSVLLGIEPLHWVRSLFLVLKLTSLLAYTVTVLILLKKHRALVDNVFSNTEEKYLGWINFLSWGILILWMVAFTGIIARYFDSSLAGFQINSNFVNLALCLFIYLMGFFGIKQRGIFTGKKNVAAFEEELSQMVSIADRKTATSDDEKYKKSGLTQEKAEQIHNSLLELMEKEKPYLNPELDLFTLANMLKIPTNYLSQVINSMEEKNFADFINGFRINEVIDKMKTDALEKQTLLGIALDSGFNSKATFNRIFKKFTGLTPTEYKKRF